MRKTLWIICLATFLCIGQSHAQWTQQASYTKNNLHDVAFYNANIGYAVGENGTVLKTLNGGQKWMAVTSPEASTITSVTVLDSASVMVTTNNYGEASIYESNNQGKVWHKMLSDTRTFYATATPSAKLYSASSQIYKSIDHGISWEAQQPLNLTTTYNQITFTNEVNGMLAGNVGGFATYSAQFMRTVDGENWYGNNNFSFPNANAFSAFCPISEDSVLMFTNFYNMYFPGDSSQLILLTDFKLKRVFDDSIWDFKSRVLIKSFQDRISDCKFFSLKNGYAISEKGNIYKTVGGSKVKKEYSGTSILRAIFMLNENTGFVVGDGGLILKKNPPSSLIVSGKKVSVFPNPASNFANVVFNAGLGLKATIQITDLTGNVKWVMPERMLTGNQQIKVPTENLKSGYYNINLVSQGTVVGNSQLIIQK